MQDRFKFRFWHKPTQKMVDCYGYNEVFVFGDVLDGIGTEYNPAIFDDCILMQCTGLKDKNGKLIYEGDIVQDDHHAKHQVVWCYNSYELKPLWKDGYTIGIVDDEIEVIGNIYENPEFITNVTTFPPSWKYCQECAAKLGIDFENQKPSDFLSEEEILNIRNKVEKSKQAIKQKSILMY